MHALKHLGFTQLQQTHNSLIRQNKISCMGKMKKGHAGRCNRNKNYKFSIKLL